MAITQTLKKCKECGRNIELRRNGYTDKLASSNYARSMYCSKLCAGDAKWDWKNHIAKLARLTESDWDYLAWTIDLEGSIVLSFNEEKSTYKITYHYRWCIIAVVNTNLNIINKVATLSGGAVHKSMRRCTKHKDKYQVVIPGSKAALYYLERTLPYYVAKREQAQLAIDYINLTRTPVKTPEVHEKLASIVAQCQILNKTGK